MSKNRQSTYIIRDIALIGPFRERSLDGKTYWGERESLVEYYSIHMEIAERMLLTKQSSLLYSHTLTNKTLPFQGNIKVYNIFPSLFLTYIHILISYIPINDAFSIPLTIFPSLFFTYIHMLIAYIPINGAFPYL